MGATVSRIACLRVPALPLQLVLRRQPAWRERPLVVTENERPLSLVLHLNHRARRAGIRRGMRLEQASSLCDDLQAAVVAESEVGAAIEEIFGVLLGYSPVVEPDAGRPGIFWLDPSGLQGLFSDHERWAERVRHELLQRGWVAVVVVGFNRLLALALARTARRVLVLRDPGQERRLTGGVGLRNLELPPELAEEMALLGVYTLEKLLKLRPSDLLVRYGPQAALLLQAATGREPGRIEGRQPLRPIRLQREIEPPDHDRSRLLFVIRGMLQQLVGQLAAQGRAITALQMVLGLDHAPPHEQRLQTAAPTLDLALVVDLVRLRLQDLELAAPVEQIEIELEALEVHPRQLDLGLARERRDLASAARALARLRAAFGPEAVTRARLRSAHLPEAGFGWEPVSEVRPPGSTGEGEGAPLVRRLFGRRIVLPTRFSARGELLLGGYGIADRMFGPYRLAGGWWHRRVERDYYFVETAAGEILWLYHDRPRRCWVLQGTVG